MAITSGFFNSLNGDRKYNAEDFGELFSGVLSDGIFDNEEGTALQVIPNSSVDRGVYISSGRAWFNDIWIKNDSNYPLYLDQYDQNFSRYDAIVLKIDKTDAVRAASFEVVKGTPSSSPTVPEVLANPSEDVYQYILATVRITPGMGKISASYINDYRGTDQTPFASNGLGVLTDISGYTRTRVMTNISNFLIERGQNSYRIESRDLLPVLRYWTLGLGYDGTDDVVPALGMPDSYQINNGNPNGYRLASKTVFRGRNLGSSLEDLSSTQKDGIRLGNFQDIFLGDFFVENPESDSPIIWRVVDFDYWYERGNPATDKHHLVIMPDTVLEDQNMNSSATTSGGYLGSAMHTTHIPSVKTNHIIPMFGASNILTHSEYLINTVTNGAPSAGTHTNVDVLLPSEIMMFGCKINSPMSSGGTSRMDVKNYTISHRQLELFKCYSDMIWIGEDYWLRDVANSSQFCRVDAYGGATTSNASVTSGIRPVFGITYEEG